MELKFRNRIISAAAIIGALFAGWQIAEGSFGPVAVACAAMLLLGINIWLRLAPDIFVAGAVLVGYLVGNRGFAQLHVPNVPLLPAEAVLALGLACGVWRWARAHQLPIRRDAINTLILLWIVLSAVRLPWDFRQYGFTAIRDFAMVYYALFFFLAQAWYEDETGRRWLLRCLTLGLALTTPAFLAFLQWPEWFTTVLTLGGVPVIFVKSDVAGGFMAAGVFWFAAHYSRTRGVAWLLLCALSLLGVIMSNSRAALVALAVGTLGLLLMRAWRMLASIGALLGVGLAAVVIQAAFSHRPLEHTPVYRVYESAASILDVRSARTYLSSDLGDKPDNNQFRLVWWKTVLRESWRNGPVTGLGFGYDLADEFSRIYYADANDDFSARSPHNFLVSVFARSGLLGFVLITLILAAMTAKTWRSRGELGLGNRFTIPLWLTVWSILTSACFGVVLEGPMGAVVFWMTLGLANAATPEGDSIAGETPDPDDSVRSELACRIRGP